MTDAIIGTKAQAELAQSIDDEARKLPRCDCPWHGRGVWTSKRGKRAKCTCPVCLGTGTGVDPQCPHVTKHVRNVVKGDDGTFAYELDATAKAAVDDKRATTAKDLPAAKAIPAAYKTDPEDKLPAKAKAKE